MNCVTSLANACGCSICGRCAQFGSVDISRDKAKSAVALRRPTKAFQDLIAQGGANLRLLNIGYSVLEGGIPIIVGGKVIGSIGVSGVTSQQDAQIAQAGIAMLVSRAFKQLTEGAKQREFTNTRHFVY